VGWRKEGGGSEQRRMRERKVGRGPGKECERAGEMGVSGESVSGGNCNTHTRKSVLNRHRIDLPQRRCALESSAVFSPIRAAQIVQTD
jgi:hypothetical protein